MLLYQVEWWLFPKSNLRCHVLSQRLRQIMHHVYYINQSEGYYTRRIPQVPNELFIYFHLVHSSALLRAVILVLQSIVLQ